jgi:hypothetical protein
LNPRRIPIITPPFFRAAPLVRRFRLGFWAMGAV